MDPGLGPADAADDRLELHLRPGVEGARVLRINQVEVRGHAHGTQLLQAAEGEVVLQVRDASRSSRSNDCAYRRVQHAASGRAQLCAV